MNAFREPKYRSEQTWMSVRRAWEAGETAASVARRFDVGMDNLWRRRAKEGWQRGRGDDPVPVPVEGWDRYAERRMEEFEARIAQERAVAASLIKAIQGGPLEEAPFWHLGYLYAFRAEHLGPEVAAQDRDRAIQKAHPWVEAFWDAEGRLRDTRVLDRALLRLNRDVWREDMELPDGVAPSFP